MDGIKKLKQIVETNIRRFVWPRMTKLQIQSTGSKVERKVTHRKQKPGFSHLKKEKHAKGGKGSVCFGASYNCSKLQDEILKTSS
jgi:hypothetical protein